MIKNKEYKDQSDFRNIIQNYNELRAACGIPNPMSLFNVLNLMAEAVSENYEAVNNMFIDWMVRHPDIAEDLGYDMSFLK